MRLFKFSVDEVENLLSEKEREEFGVHEGTAKCGKCLYDTTVVFVFAKDHEEALREIKNGYFYCGECSADEISEKFELTEIKPKGYEVIEKEDFIIVFGITENPIEEHLNEILKLLEKGKPLYLTNAIFLGKNPLKHQVHRIDSPVSSKTLKPEELPEDVRREIMEFIKKNPQKV